MILLLAFSLDSESILIKSCRLDTIAYKLTPSNDADKITLENDLVYVL